ncbi:MAG TPA: hypothetical protein VF555_01925 [Variovorax sp.]
MDYLAELRHQGFHQSDDQPDPEGRVQFDCDLYQGTPNEVTIQDSARSSPMANVPPSSSPD